MNLCRFVLLDSPEIPRSGIFHENRLYETNGEQAIGIHELTKIALLPPVGTPPSIRLFGKTSQDSAGFHYANPGGLIGPLGQLMLPAGFGELNVRWTAVIGEAGEALDANEAAPHVLAYTLLVNAVSMPFCDDYPCAVGPFLNTPESLEWTKPMLLEVKYGDQVTSLELTLPNLYDLVSEASQNRPILPGELVAGRPFAIKWPAAPQAGQQISIKLGDLSPLVVHLT